MCQIIAGPSARIRTLLLERRDVLESLFKSNPDGLGAAWANRRGLKIVKALPRTIEDLVAQIRDYPGDDRNLVVHFRWTTHGRTNHDNCHPYVVVPGKVAMAHNGVLHTGNAADKTRSDTWHFIQDYLADAVAMCPKIVHSRGFASMVGEFIEDNRFVFIDDDGEMTIVNREQGIEHDGMWFANTYAWDPSLLIPGYRKVFGVRGYSGWGRGRWNDLDDYESWGSDRSDAKVVDLYGRATRQAVDAADVVRPREDRFDRDQFLHDLTAPDVDACAETIERFPQEAIRAALTYLDPIPTRSVREALDGQEILTQREKAVCTAIMNGYVSALEATARTDPQMVAECMCYYFDWVDSDEETHAGEDDDDRSQVLYFMGHRIDIELDHDGWSFVVEDPDGSVVHADINHESFEAARSAAFSWVSSHTSFEGA